MAGMLHGSVIYLQGPDGMLHGSDVREQALTVFVQEAEQVEAHVLVESVLGNRLVCALFVVDKKGIYADT